MTDPKKTLSEHIETTFKELGLSVQPYDRCFIDCRELLPIRPTASEDVFRRATSEGMVFTPITGISRNSADVLAAGRYRDHGIALRLTREEFESGMLRVRLQRFMNKYGLLAEEIDLIVDLGAVDDLIVPGVSALATAFVREVPDHGKWRTFTISACGFPSSMGRVQRNSYELVERVDWIAWRDSLFQLRHALPRLPDFSDCAIQHTAGVEGFDPRFMRPSASIRYTYEDDWLLIKGESTRVFPASRQFPVLATTLVYGYLQPYFYQAGHCVGCASIQSCADGASGHGSAEVWRRYGTIHHITRAVEDLVALPWP